MKRAAVVAVLAFLTGCSNAPIAGFLDTCFPAKRRDPTPPPRPRDPILPDDRLPPPADTGGPVPSVAPRQ